MRWEWWVLILLGLVAWEQSRVIAAQEPDPVYSYLPVFDTPSAYAIQTATLYPGVQFPATQGAQPDMLQITRPGANTPPTGGIRVWQNMGLIRG